MSKQPGRYLDGALTVLKSARRPMTTGEITDEAIRRGLIRPSGKTPEATMSAKLYTHVRDTPDSPIQRLQEAGARRARRGSVRWVWRQSGQQKRSR